MLRSSKLFILFKVEKYVGWGESSISIKVSNVNYEKKNLKMNS